MLPDDFGAWVATVRDPATKANEGRRTLRAGKHAEANYEITPLPDGRFAIRVEYAFHCGNGSTHVSPWTAYLALLPTPTSGDAKGRTWQWNGSRTGKKV